MCDVQEKNYYSGVESDGLFVVRQIQFHAIPSPPSIPGLLNGALVSLAIAQRLEHLQYQMQYTVSQYRGQNYLGYRHALESALISMKRVVDDLIMSSYCILYRADVAKSRSLKVDGYGSLFSNGKPTNIGKKILETFVEPMDSFLDILSEVVNSYKHCYLLSESQMIWGADFPTVVSIYANRNNYNNHIAYHNHSLGQLLIGFNNVVRQITERQRDYVTSPNNFSPDSALESA